PNRTDSN
ncbi:lactoylglutathione lyase, partial [Vibrio parahaemolyticus EKP-021]